MALAGTSQAATSDSASAYPARPITFAVNATPGGTADLVSRFVAKQLSLAWKVNVIVENHVGGGGVIGATHVIRSAPDGYTVLVAPSALGVRAGLDRKLPYNAVRDLAGISLLAVTPSFLVVSPSLGVTSVEQLTALAKSKQDGVIYGSAGMGSTGHLHAAMFADNYGFKGVHAPYRGSPEVVNDVVAGRLAYAFAPGANALPFSRKGTERVVVLATTSTIGLKFADGKVPNPVEVLTRDIGDDWYAAFVPAGTPDEIRTKLSAEIARIIAMPEVRKSYLEIGAEPVSNTPKELDSMFNAYVERARKIGDDIGIKLN